MRSVPIASELETILPAERIKTRYIDLVSYGCDAGFYFLLPLAVVKPVSEEEILALFRLSQRLSVPLVFRTGGTSLSGQSITDGILVDLSQYWNRIIVEDDGKAVRVQPGITGAMVNARLHKYGRKIGPDPSSISSAMIGGILSNNSSGMCCGVLLNSYHTTRHIRFILPGGNSFDTGNASDYQRFKSECPEIFSGLAALRQEIISNHSLLNKIRDKYAMKNTVGYSLNAFADYDHPLDILAHLLIGAEGTLAFIAEAVMETIPDYRFKSTALLYFPDIYAACQAIVPLKRAGAEAVELMDRSSLRSVELIPGMPAIVRTLPPSAAALLVEFQDDSSSLLNEKVEAFKKELPQLSLLTSPEFTTDAVEQAFLWRVRKGLFPAVGAVRASGTTVVLEDVAFPVEQLGNAIIDLQRLFTEYHYDNAIIFGHAKDGNIHFVVTQSFNTEAEIDRYDRFLKAVVKLVVDKYSGTLKAEHGTGRNIAPFVETEWGPEAYSIMQQLKQLIDPRNLLNPGVIINDDRSAHIRNFKTLPPVEEEVDKCIECGYCEHKCPSRDITTTPRRRIVIRRELKRLKESGNTGLHQQLLSDFQYDGLDTCAVDGLCATACPVDINTGDLVKRLRRENHSDRANRLAMKVAKNFSAVESLVRGGVTAASAVRFLLGNRFMQLLTKGGKMIFSGTPSWSPYISAAPKIPRSDAGSGQKKVVYFPACISRIMGAGAKGKKNIMDTFISVSRKLGVSVIIPDDLQGSCCGQIFSSKGFADAYRFTANSIMDKLWRWSDGGAFPIVTDVSSCAHTLHNLRPALSAENKDRFDQLSIMDSVDYLFEMMQPPLPPVQRKSSVVLHPVCSLTKMGTTHKFRAVADRLADNVVVPLAAGCCGMAGDRGFLFPELTASATREEALEVSRQAFDGYYSSTKTCEMAMSEAVGRNYESILYLADEVLPAADR